MAPSSLVPTATGFVSAAVGVSRISVPSVCAEAVLPALSCQLPRRIRIAVTSTKAAALNWSKWKVLPVRVTRPAVAVRPP